MKVLEELIRLLPQRIKYLYLNLSKNNLGGNSENIKLLGKGMKYLHNNLEKLVLDL